MQLYHGTSKDNLSSIEADGITAPSYWGTEDMARQYAESFGANGIVLVADIDESDLQANMLVANCLVENGDLEDLPDENDLEYSLENLEGVVCNVDVFDAMTVEPTQPVRRKKRHQEDDLAP